MIHLRVYGEDGCEPKEEELLYVHRAPGGGWKCFLAQWQMLLKVKEWR